MKKIRLLPFLFLSSLSFCQQVLVAGNYDGSLSFGFNPTTRMVTGYYEDHTGEDGKFSCAFYIEGTVTGNQFKIKTYFPNDKTDDLIEGSMEVVDATSVKIKLPEEHGGCWNVQHFADEPVLFALRNATKWIQINYSSKDKVPLFHSKNEAKKIKSYLVKNELVYIERIENGWAYGTYYGKRTVKGWIKLSDLNKLSTH